jgi:molybdenum cofactor biosynthesis enzyme MoaA
MKLEEIGFYTLSDNRAHNSSRLTPLHRCELVLTDKCNFNCPYCRGIINEQAKGTISFEMALTTINLWIKEGLKNVRFTGGEPLLYKGLEDLVLRCSEGNVEHVAISTNGSMPYKKYEHLINAGVNDFSISLDSGCCAIADVMSGGVKRWSNVVENIKMLSNQTYVSVGMVFTEENVDSCIESVLFADSLGVSDIRVIPSAQYNKALSKLQHLPIDVLNKYPILKYRVNNIIAGKSVRGLSDKDCNRCWLALDDMACAQGKHFPCIIHLREGGDPIGKVGINMRKEREEWVLSHDSFQDPICKKNCLDVCVLFNNKASEVRK